MGDYKAIPKAILNRCSVYKLKELTIEEISTQLVGIAQKEGIEVTVEQANVIVTIAENSYGSMRQAISYLERVIYSNLWTVKEVIEELEIISNTDLIQSINNLFRADPKAFDFVYSSDILQRLRWNLNTIYKISNGIEVPKWQADQLKGLDKNLFDMESVSYALNLLFELNKYPYINQEIIDMTLIRIFKYRKDILEARKNIEPIRRRA